MSTSKITGDQLKAARALLGWSQTGLGERAGASRPTVERIERAGGGHIDFAGHDKAAQVVAALEGAGIEFIDDVGVKLNKPKRRR